MVYVSNTRKMVTVRDVIIKESDVGSTPHNTQTSDLVDERSPQLGIWHSDNDDQDDDNRGGAGHICCNKGGVA